MPASFGKALPSKPVVREKEFDGITHNSPALSQSEKPRTGLARMGKSSVWNIAASRRTTMRRAHQAHESGSPWTWPLAVLYCGQEILFPFLQAIMSDGLAQALFVLSRRKPGR